MNALRDVRENMKCSVGQEISRGNKVDTQDPSAEIVKWTTLTPPEEILLVGVGGSI